MTTGRPAGLLLRFALPLMLGNMFQQLYTVVDTAIVGKTLGVDALAALGAAEWLNWMMVGMVQGLTQGFGILMAQHFGARAMDRLCSVIGQSVTLSAICAAGLVLLGQIVVHPVLALMGTPVDILGNSVLYLRILFGGLPIVMAFNLLSCILRSMGDSRTPLYAMILAALTNIGLDLLFVPLFGWGIPGAAAATLIAQCSSCVYCLLQIRRMDGLQLTLSELKLQGSQPVRLLTLGFPMAFQNGVIAIGGMILQAVVNGYGVIFIAGYTATNKLYGLLEVAATSYGYAMVTYTGQNLGAGKLRRIRQGVTSANLIALVTSLVIAAVMMIFGRYAIGLFLSGDPVEVAQALEIGYEYLVYTAVCLPALYLLHVVRSTIQGIGNTVLPMVSGIVEFFMRTGCALLLPPLMGYSGIFASEVAAWIGADVLLVISYFLLMHKLDPKK